MIPRISEAQSSIFLRSVLVPELLVLAVRQVRKFYIPRVRQVRSVARPVLPPVVQQQHNGRQDRHAVDHDDCHFRRHVQRLVFVAERQRAEDVSCCSIGCQ